MSEPEDLPANAAAPAERVRLNPPLVRAIVQALTEVLQLDRPADALLRAYFKRHPQLGRRDRGLIAETVFDVLRHRRRYDELAPPMRGPWAQRLAAYSLGMRLGDAALDAFSLKGPEAAALAKALATDPGGLRQAIRLSLPDWLYDELLAQCVQRGVDAPHADLERLGQSLLEPAPLDLRVNLLRTDRTALQATLAEAGIHAEPVPDCDTALRVQGKPALERLAAFERGDFEVQDAGSQRLVAFAAPRRGQTVVDFCAGAGGKTLALAAAMRSSGQIFACDVSVARLQRLKPRLARSGASNVQPFALDSEHDARLQRLAGRADLVLVDAPCSGTGTLRRNPELKWRMQAQAVTELSARQASILAAAARLVKPGGALVYATCSLLARENEAIVAGFGQANPEWGAPQVFGLRPDLDGCDGFFAARWVRPATASLNKA